jgi:hypothetical protein
MRDNKISLAGFKYPERFFGPKFQSDLVAKQPLLSETATRPFSLSGS